MKRYLLLIVVLSLTILSCNKDRVKGSGPVTIEQRSVSGFTNIYVSGSTNVFITQGDAFDVKIKAYTNLLPYLETKTDNGTLTIAFRRNSNISNDNSEVYITMPELTGLSISGSSDIITSGNFSHVNNFVASISGSGNISIGNGDADNFKITISGSGNVKAFGITTKQADVSISGSGDAEINVSENLTAKISGSGDIHYKGNPPVINSNISGSGKLIRE